MIRRRGGRHKRVEQQPALRFSGETGSVHAARSYLQRCSSANSSHHFIAVTGVTLALCGCSPLGHVAYAAVQSRAVIRACTSVAAINGQNHCAVSVKFAMAFPSA